MMHVAELHLIVDISSLGCISYETGGDVVARNVIELR